MPKHPLHPSQINTQKIDRAQLSLDFLKQEVNKLNKEQKAIRLMLLEILENTRPYHLMEKTIEPNEEPPPEKSSWFWN